MDGLSLSEFDAFIDNNRRDWTMGLSLDRARTEILMAFQNRAMSISQETQDIREVANIKRMTDFCIGLVRDDIMTSNESLVFSTIFDLRDKMWIQLQLLFIHLVPVRSEADFSVELRTKAVTRATRVSLRLPRAKSMGSAKEENRVVEDGIANGINFGGGKLKFGHSANFRGTDTALVKAVLFAELYELKAKGTAVLCEFPALNISSRDLLERAVDAIMCYIMLRGSPR
ncbi:hypothetical protein F5Y14DRAFT_452586 [Nemania sp. NC0429]|nr:hypothetical protein F5Y14DRAFT_452586 [Nemania sp. NC0429]